MVTVHIVHIPKNGEKAAPCRPETAIKGKQKKKFGGIPGDFPGMPPPFFNERTAWGSGEPAPFSRIKRRESGGIGGAGSRKKTCAKYFVLRKAAERNAPGKEKPREVLSPVLFGSGAEKNRGKPLSGGYFIVILHNRTFTK